MSSDTAELLRRHVDATAALITNEKPDNERGKGAESSDHNELDGPNRGKT